MHKLSLFLFLVTSFFVTQYASAKDGAYKDRYYGGQYYAGSAQGDQSYGDQPPACPSDCVSCEYAPACPPPTVCYCPKCCWERKEYCTQECEDVPVQRYKKCCRMVPQYYEKQCCKYVPQYYSKQCCRYVPEYYWTCYTDHCKKYHTEKHCRYEPHYYYEAQYSQPAACCDTPAPASDCSTGNCAAQ